MKKAVVTGACGFIGKTLTKTLLEKGVEVYAIVTNPDNLKNLENNKLHVIKAFFEEYPNLVNVLPKDVDVVYHFAWQGILGSAFEDYSLQLNNAKYTCDAVILAVKINAKRFVLASTINTLETLHYLNENEFFAPRYANIYATSKLAADMIGKTLSYNNNLEFNTGLIAMVYGENNKSRMIPNIVLSNLIYNRESNLIAADTPYDLVYVGEVAEAFYHIGLEGKNMKTYYVGHKEIKTFKEIFDNIRDIVNPKGILNYGKYESTNAINFDLIDREALFVDTNYVEQNNFEENIINTAKWVKESGLFE